ncbi:uncharacterized membrane protein YcaP (DUF421 family) [Herbinix hemicellulosilytica]|uniref:YetF C-terminal domain-containing protein n=1 Tax=Herbinix hemicellulosilytica TaxID=1564487 RepID=A0A0H5SHD5_HERHM|nr:DUF421 domain-containing protein [Herbinix hemicellulosilytica]RBP57137.1 uncharacterized membrane protein YcaP (DUF421 family) [Herbinix hemicellulosilytica]CRZ34216.1 hypothetical protein HHT355_1013 [Herbinix hemicellulosilytica]
MQIGKVLLSSSVSLAALFLLTKILGNREMSQLSMFDYISSIAIGAIAGEMAALSTDNLIEPLFSMVFLSLCTLCINYLTCKSIKLRRFIEGQALILYQNGQIYEKNLLHAKIDIGELLAVCRLQGYFDLEEIYSIYLESNGQISILPKSAKRPLTPSDINLNPVQSKPMANVIIDGHILKGNLQSTGKDETWLIKRIQQKGVLDIKEIILATYDSTKDDINIYLKSHKKMKNDIFE